IASHLGPLLARIADLEHVTLIDRDHYEEKNLGGQAITPSDLGKSKAAVQRRRLRQIRPSLSVEAIAAPLEDLPLGLFRADLILLCLDSREARGRGTEIAWRLGVPWLDAGVRADGLLARVNAYDPQLVGGPCLECAWGEADYRALEQSYPCADAAIGEP